jgi:ribosomal protein L28
MANVKSKRLFDPETGTFKRVYVSTRALRTMARKGLNPFEGSVK